MERVLVKLTAEQQEQLRAGTHYLCATCGGFFSKGWSEDEANAESKALFGDMPEEQLAVICDVCFERGKARGALAGFPSWSD